MPTTFARTLPLTRIPVGPLAAGTTGLSLWRKGLSVLAELVGKPDLAKEARDALSWEVLDRIQEDLEVLLPPGLFFGTHPGDGALLGVWPAEPEDYWLDEVEVLEVEDGKALQSLPVLNLPEEDQVFPVLLTTKSGTVLGGGYRRQTGDGEPGPLIVVTWVVS